MVQKTNSHQVELKGDLLMIRDKTGNILKATTVPVWNAIEKANETVARILEWEAKAQREIVTQVLNTKK